MIRNLAVTYGSQLYMAAVGIVMLPFYIALLGVEAYGMVALYVALQTWLSLLDLGLSPTLGREAARYRSGASSAEIFRSLFKFVAVIFFVIGATLWAAFQFAAVPIVEQWLRNEALATGDAVSALRLTGAVLALRFFAIPLRAVLTGSEDLQWLGYFNGAITTVRSVLVIPAMMVLGADLQTFFLWQFAVGLIEVILLAGRAARWIPKTNQPTIAIGAFRDRWRFSLALASTASMWVAVTNMDKLILSGLLPLSDYAIFSIATIAAGGVLLLVGPFPLAIGPRLTRLHAEDRFADLMALYDKATQLTAGIALPAAITLTLFAEQTLWGWTGDEEIAGPAAPVLALYAAGNGLLALSSLPLQLQVAAGRMRLHVIGTSLFAAVFLPLLFWASLRWGMVGAGAAWLTVNLLFIGLWIPIVHRRFLHAPHLRWLIHEVLPVLAPVLAVGLILKLMLPWPSDRWLVIAELVAVAAVLLAVALLSARSLRGHYRDLFQRFLRPVKP